MPNRTKDDRQVAALMEFARLMRRPVPCVKWYEGSMREPAQYRQWRFARSAVYRLELYVKCGLPKLPRMNSILLQCKKREREAYSDWLKLKRKITADYLAGRRKRRPPWNFRGCN
jgi:hypothetical protein